MATVESPNVESCDVTGLLIQWTAGDRGAGDRLMELVYAELHAIAANYLRNERPDSTLQPTVLVHEAYLRLVDQKRFSWQNRSHFFAIASQMMRRILVDHARSRVSAKRGRDWVKVPFEKAESLPVIRPSHLLDLDDALEALAAVDPQKVRIVELRFFGGLDCPEIARHLGISTATLNRHWRIAKRWLYRHLCATEKLSGG